ncbi:MAG: glycosyltransferase family 2 protein [Cohaesibacteraceae bacterium]
MPLSIFLITHNEADRIGMVLEAVEGLSDDVVVVDSGSSDDTVAIAERHGARVFHRDWTGYGAQKRYAEDQCQNDWLLNLDADEVVTPALRGEIEALFAGSEPNPGAYRVKIHNIYPGDGKPRPLANDYNVVRLYHRQLGRYRDHPVYDRVELGDGVEVRQLTAPIHHHSVLSWFAMVDKANRFTSHEIGKLARKPAGVLKLRLVFEMPLQFLRNYLLRGHWLGGWKGFVFALNTAYLRTLRIAKALEHQERQGD